MIRRSMFICLLCYAQISTIEAADRFFAYNQTTAADFTGVYLAPEGTTRWGPNEALNDKDKRWDSGERLIIRNASRSRFDLKLVDQTGRTCLKKGVDLTQDTTFDIRDDDLAACRR
jgi:hypothetical protein